MILTSFLRRGNLWMILLFAILSWHCFSIKPYQAAAAGWEPDIQKLEALDKTQQDPADGILFIGSSSIRLWKTIDEDVAPYPAIQRGYGGAKFSDLVVYARRIIEPHQYRAMAVFVANDITGSKDDKTPAEVLKMWQYIVKVSQKHQPEAPVFFIEITPTNSRWKVWPQIQQTNKLIRAYCESHKNLYFIPTASQYLGSDGKPRAALFIQDQLHQNRDGYLIWGRLIREAFDQHLK